MSTPGDDSGTHHHRNDADDPVLLMLGVGKQLWEYESGDRFVERLRSELPIASAAWLIASC